MPENALARRPDKVAGTLDQLLKDGTIILFRQDGEDMLVLNPLAALIWDMSNGETDIDAIVRELRAHFPDQSSLEGDVTHYLDDLVARGYLHWRDEAA